MSNRLDGLARDLEGYLGQKIKFYFAVGWIKESNLDVLVVYYDQRETLPKDAVPSSWRNARVRTQPTFPPGVRPPSDSDELQISWIW